MKTRNGRDRDIEMSIRDTTRTDKTEGSHARKVARRSYTAAPSPLAERRSEFKSNKGEMLGDALLL